MRAFGFGVTFALAVLMGEGLIHTIFPARPESMSFSFLPIIFWLVYGIIFSFIRSRLSIVLILAVFGFYWIGNLNAVASYFHYGNRYLTELQTANLIYATFAVAFSIGVVFSERLLNASIVIPFEQLRKEGVNTVFFFGTFLFPFIWLIDELIVLRRVPILSGESIVNDMYSIQYGRLYGYGILLGVSALLIWSKFKQTGWDGRILLTTGLAVSVFAMIFDGRRVFLLAFIGALLAYELTASPERRLWKPVLKFFTALLIVYLTILYVRQGGQLIRYPDPAQVFSNIGVEYRDFAYVVTHLNPGSLKGYSWLGSAVGGGGNWLILALLGLDKNELVFSGSAYQLGAFYRSSFGIRIGLIPEIWLQYGMFGVAFCPLIALLYVWFARLVEASRSEVGRVFASMFFGVALLSFVGQASAITGYWSLLVYVLFIWIFFEQFRRKSEPQTLDDDSSKVNI